MTRTRVPTRSGASRSPTSVHVTPDPVTRSTQESVTRTRRPSTLTRSETSLGVVGGAVGVGVGCSCVGSFVGSFVGSAVVEVAGPA